MNSLFMNQISEDTKANVEKNRFAEVFAREEKRRRQIREKDYLMQNLVNRFYRSIISAIWESANKGMYYCVIEFDITCFKYMPESYGGWGISLQERIEKNLISEHGLGKPNTIVHSLFSYISDTKRELKVNGVVVTNYLDDSLKYSILDSNICVTRFGKMRPYYEESNNKRENILVELRWDTLPQERKKFFHVCGDKALNVDFSSDENVTDDESNIYISKDPDWSPPPAVRKQMANLKARKVQDAEAAKVDNDDELEPNHVHNDMFSWRARGVVFSPADEYDGSRPGYVFRKGYHGLGYYRDTVQSATEEDRVPGSVLEGCPER